MEEIRLLRDRVPATKAEIDYFGRLAVGIRSGSIKPFEVRTFRIGAGELYLHLVETPESHELSRVWTHAASLKLRTHIYVYSGAAVTDLWDAATLTPDVLGLDPQVAEDLEVFGAELNKLGL